MARYFFFFTLLFGLLVAAVSVGAAPVAKRIEQMRAEGRSEKDILSAFSIRYPTPSFASNILDAVFSPSSNTKPLGRRVERDVFPRRPSPLRELPNQTNQAAAAAEKKAMQQIKDFIGKVLHGGGAFGGAGSAERRKRGDASAYGGLELEEMVVRRKPRWEYGKREKGI